jgi:predicted DNA-binding protein
MTTTLKRTTIFLTEEQHERLRRLAFEQRTSMAKLLRDAALEILEDEEDIREGLKALSDTEGTITWREYQQRRCGSGGGDL